MKKLIVTASLLVVNLSLTSCKESSSTTPSVAPNQAENKSAIAPSAQPVSGTKIEDQLAKELRAKMPQLPTMTLLPSPPIPADPNADIGPSVVLDGARRIAAAYDEPNPRVTLADVMTYLDARRLWPQLYSSVENIDPAFPDNTRVRVVEMQGMFRAPGDPQSATRLHIIVRAADGTLMRIGTLY